jgi:hypothetical protein
MEWWNFEVLEWQKATPPVAGYISYANREDVSEK